MSGDNSCRCIITCCPMSEMMREAWSVIGWRSASYASRISGVAQPWRTPESFQARLAASAIPALMPKPPSGISTRARRRRR